MPFNPIVSLDPNALSTPSVSSSWYGATTPESTGSPSGPCHIDLVPPAASSGTVLTGSKLYVVTRPVPSTNSCAACPVGKE